MQCVLYFFSFAYAKLFQVLSGRFQIHTRVVPKCDPFGPTMCIWRESQTNHSSGKCQLLNQCHGILFQDIASDLLFRFLRSVVPQCGVRYETMDVGSFLRCTTGVLLLEFGILHCPYYSHRTLPVWVEFESAKMRIMFNDIVSNAKLELYDISTRVICY